MNCPVCGGGTRPVPTSEDFEGIIIKATVRACKDKECEFTWLPIEEEKKIDDILMKARPEKYIKILQKDVERLRLRVQEHAKNSRDFEKLALDWQKAYKDLKFKSDAESMNNMLRIGDMLEELKELKTQLKAAQ